VFCPSYAGNGGNSMNIKSLSVQEPVSLSAKLPYRDFRRLMAQLQWSVNHTASRVRLYAALIKLAPTEEQATELDQMRLEEKKFYSMLDAFYMELHGVQPTAEPAALEFDTYERGLRQAILWEREAIRQYRDTYLLTPSARVRDLFWYGMSDGADHLAGLMLLLQERVG
jgi:rubrerythrin